MTRARFSFEMSVLALCAVLAVLGFSVISLTGEVPVRIPMVAAGLRGHSGEVKGSVRLVIDGVARPGDDVWSITQEVHVP